MSSSVQMLEDTLQSLGSFISQPVLQQVTDEILLQHTLYSLEHDQHHPPSDWIAMMRSYLDKAQCYTGGPIYEQRIAQVIALGLSHLHALHCAKEYNETN